MELLQNTIFSKKHKLTNLFDNYEAFFFDIWGVLHEGGDLYPGVANIVNSLIDNNKIVRIVSNIPRPRSNPANYLINQGMNIEENMIFTSGEVTRSMLRESKKYFADEIKNIYHIGQDRNSEILNYLNISFASHPAEADLVLITAYRDANEDHADVIKMLELAHAYNKIVLCANPDTEVLHIGNIRFCAGFFAKIYEKLGGKVMYVGKPDNVIFEECKKSFVSHNARILMIGDTFETDIRGANNCHIDSALVLTGNTKTLMNKTGISDQMQAINKVCFSQNLLPKYLIELE